MQNAFGEQQTRPQGWPVAGISVCGCAGVFHSSLTDGAAVEPHLGLRVGGFEPPELLHQHGLVVHRLMLW